MKVKIVSITKAINPRDGVLWYGVAQSRSRGARVNHGLVARKVGRKLVASCSCESGLHRRECEHGDEFLVKIKSKTQRRAA